MTWLLNAHTTTQMTLAAGLKLAFPQLSSYEKLIALKKTDPAVHGGEETMLNPTDAHVLSWLRKGPNGEAVVVAVNMTAQPQTASFDLKKEGVTRFHVKTLLKTPGAQEPLSLDLVQLGAYGVWVGKVE